MNPTTQLQTDELLAETRNFALYTGALSIRSKNEVATLGYLLVNTKTGIIEAEGSSYSNSLVAMQYLQKQYDRIVPDPVSEMERREAAMNATPDFGSLLGGGGDGPTFQ